MVGEYHVEGFFFGQNSVEVQIIRPYLTLVGHYLFDVLISLSDDFEGPLEIVGKIKR